MASSSFTFASTSLPVVVAGGSSNTSPVHVPEISDCTPLSPLTAEGVEGGMEMLSYLLGGSSSGSGPDLDALKSELAAQQSSPSDDDDDESDSSSHTHKTKRGSATTTTTTRKSRNAVVKGKINTTTNNSGRTVATAATIDRHDPGRNARMAKENRERKKMYISGLESTIEELKAEIKRLNADKAAMAKQLATSAVEIDTLKVTLNNQQALNPFFQALQTIPGLCLGGAPVQQQPQQQQDGKRAASTRSKRVRADDQADAVAADDDAASASTAAPVTIPLLLNIQLVQPPK